jgi:Tfp pilus assembly protein PilO
MTKESAFASIRQLLPDTIASVQLIEEKGITAYQRPILIALAGLAVAFFMIYKGPSKTLDQVKREETNLSSAAQITNNFKTQKDFLQAYYSSFPKVQDKDRGVWLTEMVRKSMKEEGISFESLSPIIEEAQGPYVQESLEINCHLPYAQLGSWIYHLENLSRVVRVSRLTLGKIKSNPGVNDVRITVSAVFPVRRPSL